MSHPKKTSHRARANLINFLCTSNCHLNETMYSKLKKEQLLVTSIKIPGRLQLISSVKCMPEDSVTARYFDVQINAIITYLVLLLS